MRHRVHFRKLGRTTSHRLSLLKNLTTELIKHQRIKTTVAKAKELRRPAEKVVTLAKKQTQQSWRQAQSMVHDDHVLPFLFEDLATRFADRPGGYTRVLKAGNRLGDHAPMAFIEFVDNDLPPLRPEHYGVNRTKEQAAAGLSKLDIVLDLSGLNLEETQSDLDEDTTVFTEADKKSSGGARLPRNRSD